MFTAPKHLPPLDLMIADLGHPHPREIALFLGVTERTVYNWMQQNEAPRPAALALFWETTWGRSLVDAQAVNGQRVYMGLAQSLQRECDTLRARVAYLERVGTFGAANAPTLTATG